MKKFNLVLALCALVCALGLSSCSTEVVTHAYSVGLADFYSDGQGSMMSDLNKVQAYLESKGCPNGGEAGSMLITDSSDKKCDDKAAAKFNDLIKNLSYEEVAALGLHETCRFVYMCSRRESPEAERVVVGSWAYPKK